MPRWRPRLTITNRRSPNSSSSASASIWSRASVSSAASSVILASTWLTSWPVETHPRGAFLQLVGAQQGGQVGGDAVQCAFLFLACAFGGLDRLPVAGLLFGGLVAGLVAEYMRVAVDHLVRHGAHHVLKGEMPSLFAPSGRERRIGTAGRPARPSARPKPRARWRRRPRTPLRSCRGRWWRNPVRYPTGSRFPGRAGGA